MAPDNFAGGHIKMGSKPEGNAKPGEKGQPDNKQVAGVVQVDHLKVGQPTEAIMPNSPTNMAPTTGLGRVARRAPNLPTMGMNSMTAAPPCSPDGWPRGSDRWNRYFPNRWSCRYRSAECRQRNNPGPRHPDPGRSSVRWAPVLLRYAHRRSSRRWTRSWRPDNRPACRRHRPTRWCCPNRETPI